MGTDQVVGDDSKISVERAIRDPRGSSGGAPVRPLLVGVSLLAAMGALLVALLLLQRAPDVVGGSSPSPSSLPTTDPAPARSAPGSSAPTTNAAPALPEGWIEAARFSREGRRYLLGDLVAWSDGLVAVGTRYDEEARAAFGPPPRHKGRVWRSDDGTDWTDATPEDIFEQVELMHLFEADDGALVVVGNVWSDLEATSAAWETRDGETWTPVTLDGLPADGAVTKVASGARGHLAMVAGDEVAAYRSADGRTWEPTLTGAAGVSEVGAGDDGFVATASRADGAPRTRSLASADGVEWLDATGPEGDWGLVAPRGGDWFSITTTFDGGLTWASSDGLDWNRLGEVAFRLVEYTDLMCSEHPTVIHGLSTIVVMGTTLSGPCRDGAVITAGSTYATLDGVEWTRLPLGDQAFAAGAVEIGHRVVVATDARSNLAANVGVIFWASENR